MSSPNNSFVRQRNSARLPEISYISPNSIYGYMPKTNVLSQRDKPKKLMKEFTVKLSPFPSLTRTTPSPNVLINSLKKSNAANDATLSNSRSPQSNSLPEYSAPKPRVSSKRPMLSSEEDELYSKKSRNRLFDTIDLDDEEMFESEIPKEPSMPTQKIVKRSTLSLDNELQMNSPQKPVKNNEILSSYSSTLSHSRNFFNKRKFSPDEANTKVKKRTYIEELELLASDMSPYYKNIYNSKPESTPKNANESNSTSNNNLTSPMQTKNSLIGETEQIKDNFSPKADDDVAMTSIGEDSQNILKQIDLIEDDDNNLDKELFYPIPTHVFSIKDH